MSSDQLRRAGELVHQAELQVARQREIVAFLDAKNFSTAMSLSRLVEYEAALERHRQHLKRREEGGG